ncbi:MAG TPA: YoaK family protein [Myxococcaceae bacterium]|nr:YoaK family protein [Myxococcaceae bacterium]
MSTLWSFNGGYVDTAGFLTLHGLFTAHVTGNFVTFGAAMAHGTPGVAKLLALPVFFFVIVLIRTFANRLRSLDWRILESVVVLMILLLSSAAAFAIAWGPFSTGDRPAALTTGMALVAAMAIQNAAHRIHLPKTPPSTLMTGTSTQIMIDIADLVTGRLTPDARAVILARLRMMSASVASFALGCGMAALLFIVLGMKVFLLPPVIAAVSLLAVVRSAKESGAPS